MGNFALATSSLEPALAMEVLRFQESPDEAQPIMAALKQTFDEQQVAMLLARALAKAGEATNRLSQMLDTMAPDADRRRRVLRLADKLLSERDFGAKRPITDIRQLARRAAAQVRRVTVRVRRRTASRWTTPPTRGRDGGARSAAGDRRVARNARTRKRARHLGTAADRSARTSKRPPHARREIANDMSMFAQDLHPGRRLRARPTRIVEALRAASRRDNAVAADACLARDREHRPGRGPDRGRRRCSAS